MVMGELFKFQMSYDSRYLVIFQLFISLLEKEMIIDSFYYFKIDVVKLFIVQGFCENQYDILKRLLFYMGFELWYCN